MNKKHICRRIVSLLFTAFLAVMLVAASVSPVSAANTKQRYITELRVESGEGAIDKLEKDGWSVMMVGLNITSDAEKQVYLAYKTNTGDPITNIVVSSDEGDTVTASDGIKYSCVSHTDVDKGLGGKSGCIYATRDKHAGNPIVGIDVLRASAAEKDTLYPITNDGAELVRTPTARHRKFRMARVRETLGDIDDEGIIRRLQFLGERSPHRFVKANVVGATILQTHGLALGLVETSWERTFLQRF